MTVDGQSTLDYDDALSIQDMGDCYLVGVHIMDVAHHVKKGDAIDLEALSRGSSIYMPDHRISMLPPLLAEGVCSLKAGENVRPFQPLSKSTRSVRYCPMIFVPALFVSSTSARTMT